MTGEMQGALAQLWLRARDGTLPPLAGRDCGECMVCCINPSIDSPQMQKLSGARCRHLGEGCCTIHAERPAICREFFCAWRQLPFLGEEWRPDRAGVMMKLFVTDGITGLLLLLTEAPETPERTVRRPWFIAFVSDALMANVPLWLAIDGPRGHDGAQMMLNSREMGQALAASKGAQGRMKEQLQKVLAELRRFSFQPGAFAHHGNDVSMP